jgi:hypothetical protein
LNRSTSFSRAASGSRAAYTRDGENRLIQAGPEEGGSLADGAIRVSFRYDYLGRRVRKVVESYNAGSGQPAASRERQWSNSSGVASGRAHAFRREGGISEWVC